MIIIILIFTLILSEFGFLTMAVLGDIHNIKSMIVIGTSLSIINFVIIVLLIFFIIIEEY